MDGLGDQNNSNQKVRDGQREHDLVHLLNRKSIKFIQKISFKFLVSRPMLELTIFQSFLSLSRKTQRMPLVRMIKAAPIATETSIPMFRGFLPLAKTIIPKSIELLAIVSSDS